MYFLSSLLFTSVALTTLVSSKPYGNHVADLSLVLAESGLLPPPPEISAEAQEECLIILTNSSQTMPEFEENTKHFVEKYGLTEKMEEYGSKVVEKLTEFKNKYNAVLNNLVSVEQQYQDIINSKTMTIAEITEEVERFQQQNPLELEVLQCLFEKLVADIRENASKGDNQEILQIIQEKEKMMKAMKFMRRK